MNLRLNQYRASCLFMVFMLSQLSLIDCQLGNHKLHGIGYREQELQQAKGSRFKSDTPSGIAWASFGGGTNIYIKGYGLNPNPEDNRILLYSVELDQTIMAPLLTEDDAFGSHTKTGYLQYRLGSAADILNVPRRFLDSYLTMTFRLDVQASDGLNEEQTLKCDTESKCTITFQRSYTPIVHYLSPPVVYFESMTEVWFNPKSTTGLITGLQDDEMMFINTKIAGNQIDFEFNVDSTTTFSHWQSNRVTGQVGDQLPAASQNLTMLWETGYADNQETENLHCSYDNSTCYQVKTVPVIFETSENTGYKTGGQNLTLTGHGLGVGNVSATVDGVECTVTAQSNTAISCFIGETANASATNASYVGHNGLRRTLVNTTHSSAKVGMSSVHDETNDMDRKYEIATTFAAPYGEGNYLGNVYKGWFVPPKTTQYRFYMACDDNCLLKLGKIPDVGPEGFNATEDIITTNGNTDHRLYHKVDGRNRVSEWKTLEEGKNYYIESHHVQGTGGSHFTVAVEINQTEIVGHHHAIREIQQVGIKSQDQRDTVRFTIDNPDGKSFKVVLMSTSGKMYTSGTIKCGYNIWQFRAAIIKYYWWYVGSNIDVSTIWYDADGNVTTSSSAAVKMEYNVTLQKLINGQSVQSIFVSKVDTKATIKVELPTEVQVSSKPISGKFRVKCVDATGQISYSEAAKYNVHNIWFDTKIMNNCTGLYDRIETWDAHTHAYKENGRANYIYFKGINEDPGQFEIVSDWDTPLEGDNITFFQETTRPYGTNLFYDPVPFEMLKTYDTIPQIVVTVNDLPVVCHNLTCGFNYTEPVGEIASFTFDTATNKLTLVGTAMPSNASDIYMVEFAQSTCTLVSGTVAETGLECTLDREPTCGSWVPKLTAVLGVIPNAVGVAKLDVECAVTSAEPDFDLNIIGGDNITISGEHFPWDLVKNNISVTFNDADSTTCTPQVSQSTNFVCLTNSFSETIDPTVSLTMTIIVNNLTVTNTLSLTLRNEIKSGVSITPSSVSPVLKQNVTIQLETDFPYTLNRDDFTVNATSETNSTYIRYMNVIDVDDANKRLVCKFGGAYSGMFSIRIRHAKFGLIKSTLLLDVSANTTSIDKNRGSIYGGTLITITGQNYGTVSTDNPVQISTMGSIGSLNCYVISTNSTTIVCRTDESRTMTPATTGDVVVFLKTSEESPCEKPNCEFTYTSNVPTISTMQANFDSTANVYKLMVTGTSFSGDTSTTELYIGGKLQKCDEVTDTSATFTVTDISDEKMASAKLYFDLGLPDSHSSITGHGLTLEPKLISMNIQDGSLGGSLITANVQGVGPSTSGFELVDSSSGSSICKSVNIPSYGVVECTTIASEIAEGTTIQAKLSGTAYDCAGSDATLCQYKQLSTGTYPNVTATDISTGSMVFTGTNFVTTAAYQARTTYCGIYADTVTVDSATQVTATWTLGIPPCGTSTPVLSFNTSELIDYANGMTELVNDVNIASSSAGLTVSWQGGKQLQIQSAGLSSLLKSDPSQYNITVCENLCEFSEADSTNAFGSCTLPDVSTTHSDANYNLQASGLLKTGMYIGNRPTVKDPSKMFDGDLLVTYNDFRKTSWYGMKFKAGYVGVLDKAKYYVPGDQNKDNYIGNLILQGTNDDWATFQNLYTVEDSVSSGWNSVEFNDAATKPKYNQYRWYANADYASYLTEVEFFGVQAIDSSTSTHDCFPKVYLKGTETVLTNAVTFDSAQTPNLTAISPRFGTVQGGEPITFTGTGFPTAVEDINITIDGKDCAVQTATETQVVCLTSKRPGYVSSSLVMSVKDKGYVATNALLFTYVNYWSHDTTWGMEFAPMAGESIHIPSGLNLYMDIDKTPELNLLIVEGELIIGPNESDPNHHRYFDAHYILVSNGRMQVGTEEFPYTSKLTITMHSMLHDPYLPLFGNKCIGLTNGILDMHGPVRVPTWTTMNTTSEPGATSITLSVPVDWVAGEEIAIASTSFNGREAEKRTILSVDNSNPQNPVLQLDKALEFKHFAATEHYGDKSIDIRAEVGLLTRNIKYKGDDATTEINQYGAIIFMHSAGDDSLAARLSYTEFTNVGQAFKQGRYPIHFHLIGEIPMSYAKGNSVHKSFNRAFTIHGTKYLRIIDNVAFDTKGHTIFIEDGIERRNLVQGNLIMMTKRSWSLLNTDQTPACIWITNPDNDFIGNHAAGSDRYGYWYDLQEHAIGPSADTSVCPENEQVGVFRDNHAHSAGRYGLRIFHNMVPRKFPCKPIVYDGTNTTDPWHQNPIITANFYNLTSWKNGRNGAIAKTIGDIRFIDFKVSDNELAGIEMSVTDERTGDSGAGVYDALIIGRTANEEKKLLQSSPKGIISARSENFTINGVEFYNFDWNSTWGKPASALSTCSHCYHPQATDSGARTITTSNLKFDSTVHTRIRYDYPYKAIFYDLDGTLTEKGPQTWATHHYPHLDVPECEHLEWVYNGVTCDNTAQVRRVAFRAATPNALFSGMEFRIVPYDENLWTTPEEKQTYLDDKSKYGKIIYKQNYYQWAAAFVTGHRYKVHWGQAGIDWETMQVGVSERWNPTDKPIIMVHNHTDVRANITVKDVASGEFIANNTLTGTDLSSPTGFLTGQNVHYPDDTGIREIQYAITGIESDGKEKLLNLEATRCTDCYEAIVEVDEVESETRLWSNPKSWPNETVPVEGDDVHIESGWNMTFDMENSPTYGLVRVNGYLTFLQGANLTFNAKHIFIRAGELHVGSKEEPHNGSVTIKLHGEKDSAAIAYDGAVETGNKVIANYNILKMYGKPRLNKMSRLLSVATKGADTFTVETGLDWVPGDRIVLLPTGYVRHMRDECFIQSYDNTTGVLTINTTLNHYHWGQAASTAAEFNGADVRGEVVLLTRSVKIVGEDVESWGGHILTGDTVELDGTEIKMRTGHLFLDHVEVYNNSQIDTMNSAIRWENAMSGHSSVTNCTLHNGFGWGINVKASANIELADNIIYNFRPIGVAFTSSTNISFHDNIVGHITERETFTAVDNMVDKRGGVAVCSYFDGDSCTDVNVYNNIASGIPYAGFITGGHDCGDSTSLKFKNNTAHTIDGVPLGGAGGYIFPDKAKSAHSTCFEAANFTTWKSQQQGVYGRGISARVVLKDMTMADNMVGFGYAAGVPGDVRSDTNIIEMTNVTFYGETPIPDCPDSRNGDFCIMEDKYAYFPGMHTPGGDAMHCTGESKFPLYNHHSNPTMGGRTVNYNNKFINFNATTPYGKNNMVFGSNSFGSDYTEMQEFFDCEFINVQNAAIATLDDPTPGWANKKDCGSFPCTAPWNVLFSFQGSKWETIVDENAQRDWQIISSNPGFSPYIEGCNHKENWNGYQCFSDTLSMLVFENDDWDAVDRTLAPIYVKQVGTEISSKVNSYMDHVWDGFYAGQIRTSRYPVVVDAKRGNQYDVEYTGNTPKNQTFTLKSQNRDAALILRIFYPDTGSFSIYANEEFVESNSFNDETKQYDEISGTKCGENRFLGIVNILEFYLTPGCIIKIKPRDAIQTMVRMEWTLDQFFSNGGTTTFADRVAGSLGIHASDIKIVSVYEGSLVVNYDVTVPEGSTTSIADLQAKQTQAFATGSINLGAPILDVAATVAVAADTNTGTTTTEATSIVSDGTVSADGYDPIVITTTKANRVIEDIEYVDGVARRKSVFRPNIQTILEEETIYQNVTVQKIAEQDKLDPTIIKIKAADDGSTSWIIIMISIVLLSLVLVIFFFRYFYYKSKADMIQAERRLEQKADFEKQLEKAEVMKKEEKTRFSQVSSAHMIRSGQKFSPVKDSSVSNEVNMIPEYCDQYDPNQDFAIFQVGNGATGGVMNLQEKMNVADNVNNSSDEDDTAAPKSTSVANKLSLANSTTSSGEFIKSRPSSSGSSSNSQKRLTFDSLPPNGQDLPEDREIISELGEEEEEDC